MSIFKGIILLILLLFLGISRIYICGIPIILIITCFCITGLFYTGFKEIIVSVDMEYESDDCTLGIINIFLGLVLLSMALSNHIVN